MNIAIKTAKKIFSVSNIKSIDKLGSSNINSYIKKHKIVVFVPIKNINQITFAMAEAGAGVIGNYKLCSFRVKGTGTFMGNKSSNPTAGKKGKFETVDEIRLEMICSKKNLDAVIDKMLGVHPYEEPVYEIYEVMIRKKMVSGKIVRVKLKRKITVKNVFKKINDLIDASNLPKKIKNAKIEQAIVDISDGGTFTPENSKNKTLYIKRNKNITNIEII